MRSAIRTVLTRLGLVVSTLALATLLVLGFRSPDELAIAAAARQAHLDGGPGSHTTADLVAATPEPTPTPKPKQQPVATGRPGPTQGGGRGVPVGIPTDPPDPTPTPKPPPAGTMVVTGTLINTRFGMVQVAVTVANGKILDLAAVQLPTGGRSGSISRYAGPLLRSEALTANGSSIQIVSGATYTSRAYAQSLQAALDQVHA